MMKLIKVMNKNKMIKPTPRDIELFNKTLKYTQEHGTDIKCHNCGTIMSVPKTIELLNTDEWREIFGKLSRQSITNRLNRWITFQWIDNISTKANKIKVKKYYPIPFQQRLKAHNKKIK